MSAQQQLQLLAVHSYMLLNRSCKLDYEWLLHCNYCPVQAVPHLFIATHALSLSFLAVAHALSLSVLAAALCSQLVAQPSQQPAASMGQPSGSGGQAAGSGPPQPQPAAAPLPGPECNAQPSLQQLLLHAVAAGLVGTGPSVLSLLQ